MWTIQIFPFCSWVLLFCSGKWLPCFSVWGCWLKRGVHCVPWALGSWCWVWGSRSPPLAYSRDRKWLKYECGSLKTPGSDLRLLSGYGTLVQQAKMCSEKLCFAFIESYVQAKQSFRRRTPMTLLLSNSKIDCKRSYIFSEIVCFGEEISNWKYCKYLKGSHSLGLV